MTLFRTILALLAGLLLTAGTASAQDPSPRLVAIGDLHGDYVAYLDILQATGLGDKDGNWTGGDSVLVQMGDIADRGPGTLDIIIHIRKLQASAAEAGGKVVVLVGNHEAMNVTGDLRYVTPEEYAAFETRDSKKLRSRLFRANKEQLLAFYRASDQTKTERDVRDEWFAETPLGKLEHRFAWSPEGEIGQWVGSLPAIYKFGDTLFVHGGISVETATKPIAVVNKEVSTELAKGESTVQSILTDPFGPLWYRGNVRRVPGDADNDTDMPNMVERLPIGQELTQVLTAYDAARLVVAHTPNPPGIVATQAGRLIRVDTGISAYYGGVRSYLEIEGGQTLAWHEDKNGEWTSEALPQPDAASQPVEAQEANQGQPDNPAP